MAYKDVRVIVSTTSTELFTAINKNVSVDPEIESINKVLNITEAERYMIKMKPNVLLVDTDRGVASYPYLKQLMEKYKLLVILTATSSVLVNSLLQGGIREFLPKPKTMNGYDLGDYCDALRILIRNFTVTTPQLNYLAMQRTVDINTKIVAIASSTGGTEALEKILKQLPSNIPPILIVQHMPSGFTKFFADRLNSLYPMEVREATNNDYLQRGLVLIAPADQHMTLVRRNSRLSVECFKGQKIHGVMPAADVLFDSIAPIMHSRVLGIVLTGMGADGAKGLLKMHIAGAKTIGQNKETCVVYGMPKVAFDLGAVDMQLPIDKIADQIMAFNAT